MNKRILIHIIKQALVLFRQNQLTTEAFQKIVSETPFEVLNDDRLPYYETELLCYMFSTIPYYRIYDQTFAFMSHLEKISKGNNHLESIADLSTSYITDIFININSRINTEVNAHIYELAAIYYQCGELDYDLAISRLKRRILNPEYLVSLECASDYKYQQTTLPGFDEEKLNMREHISKSNYNKKANSDRSIKKAIIRVFNIDSFEKFIKEVEKVIKKYQEENPIDADFLKDSITIRLKELLVALANEWEKSIARDLEAIDQYRLTL